MSGKRMTARAKAVVMILSGILAGSLLGGPAAAHVGNKVGHLVNRHLVNFFYTEAEADSRFINATEKASDSNLLDGVDGAAYLRTTGKAADADLLDGISSAGFLAAAGKAVDADKLDNIDSAAFLQGTSTLSGTFSCPGSGFSPDNGDAPATDANGLRTAGVGVVRCAAHLPNGATVSGVSFRVKAPATTDVTVCSLTRTPLTATATETHVAGPAGAAVTGDSTFSPALVAGNTVISNGSFGYYLKCTLTASGGIYGAIVTYSVSASAG